MRNFFTHHLTGRFFLFITLLILPSVGVFAQAPTIVSCSPANAAAGTAVTITGTGFNATAANNIVFFGAVRANVTAASATSLTVTVPYGAVYGHVTELNTSTALAAYSAISFNPTFSPAKNGITAHDFVAKIDNATGTTPYAAVIGDLDGDGKPDIAVANSATTTVSVLLNNGSSGNPGFAAKVDFTVGANARSLAIGDLDGDGKPDLAVANYNNNTVSVLRNTSSAGSVSFATKVDVTTGTNPYSVSIADLNGDGKPDLAVANFTSSTISVLQNTSTGLTLSFAAKLDFASGTNPQAVAIGDIDGDGKPDLVAVNNGATTVSVLLNTGSAGSVNFGAKSDFTIGSGARNLAIGDLDGDGKLDLAVANYTSNTVSVLRNTSISGTAAFAAKIDLVTGTQPTAVAIGDLDGDGRPDLAVSNNSSSTASVFHNTSSSGTISFDAKVDFASGTSPKHILAGDLDGDGKPDLLLTNGDANTVSLIRNTYNADLSALTISSGTLSPVFSSAAITYTASVPNSTSTVTVTPTRSDAGATLQIQLNSGGYTSIASGGASSPLALVIGPNTIDIKVTALDGATTKVYTVTVVRTPIPPAMTSFSPLSGPVGSTVTITGTGFNTTAANNIIFFGAVRAVVTAASAISLTVTVPYGASYGRLTELNTATSLGAYSVSNFMPTFTPSKGNITVKDFAAKVDYTTGTTPYGGVVGDIDGDGKPDIAVVNSVSATVSVFLNTGTSGSPGFAPKIDFAVGTNARSIAIGDIDGDGKLDIAVGNYGSNTVSVLRNTSTVGTISFAGKVDLTTGTNPYAVAIGDIDGDGKADVVVGNFTSSTVSVFLNTATSGSLSFAAKVDMATGTNPQNVAIGDLDGDGKPDLVAVNNGATTVSVLLNTGTVGSVTFAAKSDFTIGSGARSVAIGDLDGDGKPDLAVANYTSNTLSILRNTGSLGTVGFAAKTDITFIAGTQPTGVVIADMDGDGKPDLAVSNNGASSASILRNTSTSGVISFAAKVDFASGTSPKSMAVTDMDGDGKPDLVLANGDANSVSIIRNAPLFPPSAQSSNITFTNIAATSVTANWTAGNGTARLVFMAAATTGSPLPVDITTYVANAAFGSGSQIGTTGWYCVYNGTGSSVAITGLTSGTTYRVMVVDYNGVAGNELYNTNTGTNNPANVTPLSPVISSSGTLAAISTTYGTPSATANFSISGANMTAGILVSPSPGFELSSDNLIFSPTLTIGASGNIASTVIYIRLASSTLPNTYPGNIVLSSNGATDVNVPVSGIVSPAPLTITADNQSKVYGSPLPVLTATYSGFVNGDTPNTLSTPATLVTTGTAISPVTGTPLPITASGASSSNYTIVYIAGALTVTPAALAVTANNVSKLPGVTLTGGPNSTAFTTVGLVNNETAGTVTIAYGSGAAAGDPQGVYSGQVTPSLLTGGNFTASNYAITYIKGGITVGASSMTTTGTLAALATTYGTASVSTTFNVSGSGLTNNITISAPSGFEISTSAAGGFAGTVILTPVTGLVNSTAIFLRLSAGVVAGTYSGNITLTRSGAATLNLPVVPSLVSPAPLTITAGNTSKIYGAANPNLTVTYLGFVGTDNAGSLTTQPSVSTVATAGSPVNTYPITAGGASSSNYNITYVPGTLSVIPAVLTITANNQSKTQGDANPNLTVTYGGFVNGDSPTSLTTAPVLNTPATVSSPVGNYPITASAAVSANYTITYIAGVLTIKARTNASLSSLAVSTGTLSPVFAPGTISYSIAVVNAVSSINVTPTAADGNASIKINNVSVTSGATSAPIPLSVGSNLISISVTAQDGVTNIFYTIAITRAASNNASLSSLTLNEGSLSPAFSSALTAYTATVVGTINAVSVTPVLADRAASILVNGVLATSGSLFTVSGLTAGDNKITIVVTAQDGVTITTYTVTVYKAAPPEKIIATNILSPNGDGKNDYWVIKDILLYPNNSVKVFDRSGRIVFTTKGYANNWGGTLNGSPLAEDTYYYVVDLGIDSKPFTGFITILKTRN